MRERNPGLYRIVPQNSKLKVKSKKKKVTKTCIWKEVNIQKVNENLLLANNVLKIV